MVAVNPFGSRNLLQQPAVPQAGVFFAVFALSPSWLPIWFIPSILSKNPRLFLCFSLSSVALANEDAATIRILLRVNFLEFPAECMPIRV